MMNEKKQTKIKFIIPLIILIVLFGIALSLGTKFISPILMIKNTMSKLDYTIVTKIRLPRILISILCGSLLGGTGAVFQGFFRNPLADSGIMGISSGATFGAVVSGLIPISTNFLISKLSFFAFAGAILSCICIYLVSKIFRERSSVTLLLSGVAIGTFFSALASILILVYEQELHSFLAWSYGSFNSKGWNEFFIFIIPSIIALILLQLSAKHLDVLVCGEQSAKAFGLNYNFVRNWILVSGSLATACAVCEGGVISFVGLIAPHIVRKIYGPLHKTLIFESMIFGSILMLFADTIARTIIAPSEISVGIITSLIGVPFFIFALAKMSGGHS